MAVTKPIKLRVHLIKSLIRDNIDWLLIELIIIVGLNLC